MNIFNLNLEIIKKIAQYLNYEDEKNFFYSHKYFSDCLRDNHLLKIKTINLNYIRRIPFYKNIYCYKKDFKFIPYLDYQTLKTLDE